MSVLEETILLHLKNKPRSGLMLPQKMYDKNKEHYDKVGYVVSDEDQVKEYFRIRGINIEPKKEETKKQASTKSKKTKSIAKEDESSDN